MNLLFRRIVARIVRTGSLAITSADGAVHRFGDGSGDPVHVVINTKHAERAVAFDPMLALGEAYMDGEIDFREGDVLGMLRIACQNMGPSGIEVGWTKALEGFRHAFRRLQQINSPARSKRNVARHYDLSREFYQLFLDADMQYSCAYFERPDASLEEAQLAKKRHIAAKLRMGTGHTLLDIGSGWGGLGLYMARRFEADVL